jgi:EmrB/QacA subfamily drug resistance transporter
VQQESNPTVDRKVQAEGTGGNGQPPINNTSPAKIPMAALLTLLLGSFMAFLDSSIVNIALPKLMSVFNVSVDQVQWVSIGYMLTAGMVVPITGYLSDKYGSKRMYMLSLICFTLGSAACSVAWSNQSLIIARVFQAIGGGMMIPVSMTMIYFITPRSKIGLALGIWGIAAMAAPAIGPSLGGYLIDNYRWQSMFMINIPIGLLATILSALFLVETSRKADQKADYLGAALITIGSFCLLLALSAGQVKGWSSPFIVYLLVISSYTLALFAVWEFICPHPVLELRLLRNKTYTASLLAFSISIIGLFSGLFMIPLFVQTIQGYTPIQTGLMLMPMAVIMGLMMPVSGWLFDKIGALPLCLTGLIITAITTFQLHTINYDTSLNDLQWLLIKRGVGLGLCMSLTTAGMNSVPQFLIGRASALNNLARQISASFGIVFLTHVMLHQQAQHISLINRTITSDSMVVREVIYKIQGVSSKIAGIQDGAYFSQATIFSLVQREAFTRGLSDSFVVSTIIILLAIPFVFLLSKKQVEASRISEYKKYHLEPPGSQSGKMPSR